MNFLETATKLWTNAKTTILANVAQVKDDVGIEQIYISEDFEKTNQNFVRIMRRSNQMVSSFVDLSKCLCDLTKSFSNICSAFEQCSSFCESASFSSLESLKKVCDDIDQITKSTAKQIIYIELIKPYSDINNSGNKLYPLRTRMKSNFSLYQQYRNEYGKSYSVQASNSILDSLKAEMDKYKTLFECDFEEFKKTVKQLLVLIEDEDNKCIEKYKKIEQQYVLNIKSAFDELTAEDPKTFNVDVQFVNIVDDDFDVETAQPKNTDNEVVPLELDSAMPSLE